MKWEEFLRKRWSILFVLVLLWLLYFSVRTKGDILADGEAFITIMTFTGLYAGHFTGVALRGFLGMFDNHIVIDVIITAITLWVPVVYYIVNCPKMKKQLLVHLFFYIAVLFLLSMIGCTETISRSIGP